MPLGQSVWMSTTTDICYRPDCLTLDPGKVMEQLILEKISRHMKDKVVIGISQHGFTKAKSCLTNLITYNELTGLVDKGREMDIVNLDFSMVFKSSLDTVLGNLL
ncbi:rna-directed dna polymerase from mobile element jockey- hypothetical protein [Limosa lapponica baueri]|uniref:Rna-directed dna polymerase from mobile element jockey-like n=1 Tax=Limosa lapponica baueri TaxID=1758121 RepID=A0A2I0U7H4_LIMLA|nr:rna-directed dna polymerase from mobile element jockey- hypothetical protein [Limosa lapponica baueri]